MKKLLKDIKLNETIKVFEPSSYGFEINEANVTRITEKTIRADNSSLRITNYRDFETLNYKNEYPFFFTTRIEAIEAMLESKKEDVDRNIQRLATSKEDVLKVEKLLKEAKNG